jgi:hypothetical protein
VDNASGADDACCHRSTSLKRLKSDADIDSGNPASPVHHTIYFGRHSTFSNISTIYSAIDASFGSRVSVLANARAARTSASVPISITVGMVKDPGNGQDQFARLAIP